MIKAIIFDFFGVLAVRGTSSFKQTYFPNDQEKIEQAKQLHDDLGLGAIGYNDFIDGLAKIGGVKRAQVLEFTENYLPNIDLLNYMRDILKPRYKLGIISNAGEDWVLKILGPQNQKLFDDIILSYKVEIIKPDPKIYKLSAHQLMVREQECIFIDDILTYCKGAESTGMKSVWYRDFEQMKLKLEKLLAVSDN